MFSFLSKISDLYTFNVLISSLKYNIIICKLISLFIVRAKIMIYFRKLFAAFSIFSVFLQVSVTMLHFCAIILVQYTIVKSCTGLIHGAFNNSP